MVLDFVQNITNLNFERVVAIVRQHSAGNPQFYIVRPEVNDSMMSGAILDLVKFLSDTIGAQNVTVIQRDQLEQTVDATRLNVIFHMQKSVDQNMGPVPLQRYDTPFVDFLFIYEVPEGYTFPPNYDVIDTFGTTALIRIDV